MKNIKGTVIECLIKEIKKKATNGLFKKIIYIESLFFISFSLNNWCILLNKYLGK